MVTPIGIIIQKKVPGSYHQLARVEKRWRCIFSVILVGPGGGVSIYIYILIYCIYICNYPSLQGVMFRFHVHFLAVPGIPKDRRVLRSKFASLTQPPKQPRQGPGHNMAGNIFLLHSLKLTLTAKASKKYAKSQMDLESTSIHLPTIDFHELRNVLFQVGYQSQDAERHESMGPLGPKVSIEKPQIDWA